MLEQFDGKAEIFLETNKDKETIISKIYHEGISMVSPTIHLDMERIPCYYLIHLGGGYVEGEETYTDIKLGENARSIITTQAPTIIYKCDNDIPSKQWTTVNLGKNSILEYFLDNTILFKDALYEQYIDVYMDKSSTFIFTDGITSGWSADGKDYQYKQAKLRTRIYIDDEPVLIDKLMLNPKLNDVSSLGTFEGYLNYGTAAIINHDIDEEFISELRKHLGRNSLDVKYGLSKIESAGLVIRVVGNYAQDIQTILYDAVNYTRKKFFNSLEIDLRKP